MINKEKFFKRNENVVNRFIRRFIVKKKTPIVHGGRSQNVQLPKPLEKRPTKDWDIFTKFPEKRARELEKVLDKKFRGDFFMVKKGVTKKLRVNKVVSNVTGESFADFSVPDRQIPTIAKRGVRFATLKDQVERAKQNIKKPELKFRRERDLSLIKRAKKFRKNF